MGKETRHGPNEVVGGSRIFFRYPLDKESPWDSGCAKEPKHSMSLLSDIVWNDTVHGGGAAEDAFFSTLAQCSGDIFPNENAMPCFQARRVTPSVTIASASVQNLRAVDGSALRLEEQINRVRPGRRRLPDISTFAAKIEDTEKLCAICCETQRLNDTLLAVPGCGHVLHDACVRRWLNTKGICPICRGDPKIHDSTRQIEQARNRERRALGLVPVHTVRAALEDPSGNIVAPPPGAEAAQELLHQLLAHTMPDIDEATLQILLQLSANEGIDVEWTPVLDTAPEGHQDGTMASPIEIDN